MSSEVEDVIPTGEDPCPAVLEIGPLSPIRCSEVLLENCQDEGYITQDFPITPIMSTPLRPHRQTPDLVAGAEAALSVNSLVPCSLDNSSFSKGDGVWESTLLEVQVKSKVVLAGPPAAVCTFKAGRRVTPPSNKRPRVFEHPEEWQREKAIYVESVSRHMKENPKGGVINELLDLMNTVASEQHPWQHPSDLTTRNYHPGNHGKTLYSLDEWISKNGGTKLTMLTGQQILGSWWGGQLFLEPLEGKLVSVIMAHWKQQEDIKLIEKV